MPEVARDKFLCAVNEARFVLIVIEAIIDFLSFFYFFSSLITAIFLIAVLLLQLVQEAQTVVIC
jgi:hypothetical protein